MMKISSVNENANVKAGSAGTGTAVDAVTKNIQSQIANAQKKIQEISSNQEMTIDEKMKKRQEIQQEITNLNQQLRQHQIDQRKEKEQQGADMGDMLGGSSQPNDGELGNRGAAGLSKENMQAMISASASMTQAKVQGHVITKMEGRGGVLEAEIKTDGGRGAGTAQKEEELADIQQKVQAATASQGSLLAEANETVKEAAQSGQNKVDSSTNTTDKDTKKNTVDTEKAETLSNGGSVEMEPIIPIASETPGTQELSPQIAYKPVDIYL